MLGAEVDFNIDVSAGDVVQAHRKRLKDAGDRGFAFSQEVVPHERGTLKQSGFGPEFRSEGMVYGYSAKHAAPMEFGTDPGHTPPVEPLMRWAERIGKDPGFGVWVATVKIPQEGVDAQPYLRPSAEVAQQYLKTHGLDL